MVNYILLLHTASQRRHTRWNFVRCEPSPQRKKSRSPTVRIAFIFYICWTCSTISNYITIQHYIFLTHLSLSSVDIALPRRERQRRLEQKYHFQCTCVRCSKPLDDPESLDAHLDADIDGVPESQWSQERVQAVEDAKALLLRSAASEDPIKTLQLSLEAMQTELHEENISILQAYSGLFSAEMERGSIAEALPFGEKMLAFYRRMYPANHPLVGLHLFTLGDLHLQQLETQGSNQQAKKYLSEAKQILQITHGRNHHFVELLNQRINSC